MAFDVTYLLTYTRRFWGRNIANRKTNTRHVLPLYRDNFIHGVLNYLQSQIIIFDDKYFQLKHSFKIFFI